MATVHPIPTGPKFQNLTGQRFGHLDVLSYAGLNKHGNCSWNCVCRFCGKEKVLTIGAIRSMRPLAENEMCRCVKHRKCATSEYRIWKGMRRRCNDQNAEEYKNYGGRGIRVCARWKKSFPAFIADMGERSSADYSIDRFPDNNGHYSCGKCEECKTRGWAFNCRWATENEQARNRRSNTLLTHDGKTLLLVEWAEITGLKRDTIMRRINAGWSIADALTKPLFTKRKQF